MVVEFFVKNMVILDSGGNYLYVKESAASFTKIGAFYKTQKGRQSSTFCICYLGHIGQLAKKAPNGSRKDAELFMKSGNETPEIGLNDVCYVIMQVELLAEDKCIESCHGAQLQYIREKEKTF